MLDVVFQGKIYAAKTPLILLLRLLAKTTACFDENDTLFLGKRHVVLVKTTRCLRGIMGGFKKDFPTILLWVCFSEDYANTVTLVTAKKQKLL